MINSKEKLVYSVSEESIIQHDIIFYLKSKLIYVMNIQYVCRKYTKIIQKCYLRAEFQGFILFFIILLEYFYNEHVNFNDYMIIYDYITKSQVFPGGSVSKESTCDLGEPGSIPGSGRSPGEGNGNPLQYSCLENPKDRGAWWATVHGVTQS